MVAPPMQPPMMGQPMQPRRDPMVDMAALRDMMEQTQPTQPLYPRWYKPPSAPSLTGVHEEGLKRYEELGVWRASLRHDAQMLRMSDSGVFRNDIDAVHNETMEQIQSTGLVDEFNLAVSWMSGLKARIDKAPGADELKGLTRKVKLAAQWLDQQEEFCHTDNLEMERSILEPKILLMRGMLAKRRVLDRYAEPYYSPFLVEYIDPAQLVPVKGPSGRRMKAIFRVYKAMARDIVESYGDFTPSTRKRLQDEYGNDFSDESELELVEYWDTWHRCVTCHGAPIVPVTEHKYGEVPYTISYGPLGEPQLMSLPAQTGASVFSGETWKDELAHKSVSYVRFSKISHILNESILTRSVYGLEQDLFPPVMRYRSTSAAQSPAEDLDFSPGFQNEAEMGEERLEPMPRNTNSAVSHQHVMQHLERDRMTGRAPLAAYGIIDQSNISGTANKQGISAGQHLWKYWVKHQEGFRGRDLTLALRLWQRFGHVVEHATPQRRPFVVPVSKPYHGEAASFELDKQTLNKVGPDVRVSLVNFNTDEWLLRAQTMQLMRQEGFNREWLAEHLFGVEYDAQMNEEWQEENLLLKMWEHPKFLEIVGIRAALTNEIAEAEGDPDQQQQLIQYLQEWEALVVQPAMLEHQMQMQQMQMQQQQMMAVPGPDEAVPEGQMPQQPGGGGGGSPMPPTTQGVSLPDFGGGPGSVTGSQSPGRPTGSGQGGY